MWPQPPEEARASATQPRRPKFLSHRKQEIMSGYRYLKLLSLGDTSCNIGELRQPLSMYFWAATVISVMTRTLGVVTTVPGFCYLSFQFGLGFFFCPSASVLPSYLLSRSFKHVPAANTVSRVLGDAAGRRGPPFLLPHLAFGSLSVLLPSLSATRVWGRSAMLCLALALRARTPSARIRSWLCPSDAHLAADLSMWTPSGLAREQAA